MHPKHPRQQPAIGLSDVYMENISDLYDLYYNACSALSDDSGVPPPHCIDRQDIILL